MAQEIGLIDNSSLVTSDATQHQLIQIGRAFYTDWVGSFSVRITGRHTITGEGLTMTWEAGVQRFAEGDLAYVGVEPLCIASFRDATADTWVVTPALLDDNLVFDVQTPDSSDEVTWSALAIGAIEFKDP
jgi:hypothetical protein